MEEDIVKKCLSVNWGIDWRVSETLIVKVNLIRMVDYQKQALVAYLEDNKEKSLLQLSDALRVSSFGGGGAPVMPLHVSVGLKTLYTAGKKVQLQPKDRIEQPVHGPFRQVVYEDPVFVAKYTRARYESRVAEVKSILSSMGHVHIIVPGDGAGVAYQAALQLQHQGHRISVESFDSSQEMCDVAHRLGNIVKKKTIAECLKEYRGSIFLLSHVTDYMSEEEIYDYAQQKTIIYGRVLKFSACVNYEPYDKDWGYQLCSSNYSLHGIVLGMAPRIVPEIDFTMFSCSATIQDRNIDIDVEDPLYVVNARELGLEITEQAKVVITLDLCPKRKTVAVPGVGIIGRDSGHDLFVVPPIETEGFVEEHSIPIFENPTHIGNRFFFSGDGVRTDDGAQVVIHTGVKKGVLTYFNIPKRYCRGVIQLDNCVCKGRSPHYHCLKVVNQNRVVWQNVVSDTKRYNSGKCTRQKLYESYTRARLDDREDIEAMFRYMERVDSVEYDHGTGLYHKTGE